MELQQMIIFQKYLILRLLGDGNQKNSGFFLSQLQKYLILRLLGDGNHIFLIISKSSSEILNTPTFRR